MEQFLMQFVTTPVELLAAVVGMLIVLELITLQKIKKMEKMEKQNRMWKDGIEKSLRICRRKRHRKERRHRSC